MITIKTKGTPFQRGKMQGEVMKQHVRPWIERILSNGKDSLDNGRITYEADLIRHQLEKNYVSGYEECCGIASGIGIDEISYFSGLYCNFMLPADKKCTTMGFKTVNDEPIIGKTDDIYINELGNNIMEITLPSEGFRHIHFHFAGTIWTVAGMNECGLAMAMTGIAGPSESNLQGIFSLDALHSLLPACKTVVEAVEHVNNMRLNSGGFSLLLGDSTGRMKLLEKTSAGTTEISTNKQGLYLHTNHILDYTFASVNPPQAEPLLTNGTKRYENALKIMQDIPYTEQGMVRFLSDRNKSGAIMQQGEDGLFMDFSVIFLPAQKKITVTAGYPAYDQMFSIFTNDILKDE